MRIKFAQPEHNVNATPGLSLPALTGPTGGRRPHQIVNINSILVSTSLAPQQPGEIPFDMTKLNSLKARIEQASQTLRKTSAVREQESSALINMWRQMRERFVRQNAELDELRGRIVTLETTRDELAGLIHTQLEQVEDDIEKMSDVSVWRITAMATELLESESGTPSVAAGSNHQHATEPTGSRALQNAMSAVAEPAHPVVWNESSHAAPDIAESPGETEMHDESPRVEIRSLISRVEEAFDTTGEFEITVDDGPQNPDKELARDMKDIEALREELERLRAKTSTEPH